MKKELEHMPFICNEEDTIVDVTTTADVIHFVERGLGWVYHVQQCGVYQNSGYIRLFIPEECPFSMVNGCITLHDHSLTKAEWSCAGLWSSLNAGNT